MHRDDNHRRFPRRPRRDRHHLRLPRNTRPPTPALFITATAAGPILLLYLAKRYLDRALHSEALSALSYMQLLVVLLVGSLIYRVRHGGWRVDHQPPRS